MHAFYHVEVMRFLTNEEYHLQYLCILLLAVATEIGGLLALNILQTRVSAWATFVYCDINGRGMKERKNSHIKFNANPYYGFCKCGI